MEWYKIAIGIVAWIIGCWIYSKFQEMHKNKYFNDSWKDRNKNKFK